jgi:hypothetical protein
MQVSWKKKKILNVVGLHLKDILLNLELPTFVNGELVYTAFKVKDIRAGKRLLFER